jgi:tripartite-type tricarboxylate transporter receptor subunit TctC
MHSWFAKSLWSVAVAPLTLLCLTGTAAKADPVADFYSGRTVHIITGYSAGGGYDLYSRVLAQFLGKHIPGNPTVVAENMPGAGSLRAANYLYTVAPKDGTVIGTFARGLPMQPLIAPTGIQFDAAKFGWLGSVSNDDSVCVTGDASKVKTWDQAKTTDFTVTGEGSGSDPDVFALMLRNLFDLKMKLITGYPGTNEMALAIQRGEVDGRCGWSWSEIKSKQAQLLRDKKLNVILQLSLKPIEDLPNVPNVMQVATTDRQREILNFVLARQVFGRPYTAPPGIPAERLTALRKAFDDTMQDPEFLKIAQGSGLEVKPVSGTDAEKLIQQIYATPKDVLAETRKVVVK